MSDVAKKVETLMEAMPYLEKYQGKVIVIKYGGNAMINEELKDAVLHDVVMLKLLGLKQAERSQSGGGKAQRSAPVKIDRGGAGGRHCAAGARAEAGVGVSGESGAGGAEADRAWASSANLRRRKAAGLVSRRCSQSSATSCSDRERG